MPITPAVHPDELREALDRIAKRHRDVDDQSFAMIDCENAYEVWRHLRTRPTRDERVDRADVLDGQVLQDWLWHDLRQGEHTFLTRGEKLGIPLTRLGSRRGITGQGVRDRIDAGQALITYGKSDVHRIREARRAAAPRQVDGANPQVEWLVANRDRVRDVAEQLLTLRSVASADARSWLVEVERDYDNDEWSLESPVMMSLVVAFLRTQEEFLDKSQQHTVHKIVETVNALRRDFDTAGNVAREPVKRRTPPGRRRGAGRTKRTAGRKRATAA